MTMTSIISGTYQSGITLTSTDTTITSTGVVRYTEIADAVFGPAGTAWTLTHLIQCAPKARTTSGGRFHPESCR